MGLGGHGVAGDHERSRGGRNFRHWRVDPVANSGFPASVTDEKSVISELMPPGMAEILVVGDSTSGDRASPLEDSRRGGRGRVECGARMRAWLTRTAKRNERGNFHHSGCVSDGAQDLAPSRGEILHQPRTARGMLEIAHAVREGGTAGGGARAGGTPGRMG